MASEISLKDEISVALSGVLRDLQRSQAAQGEDSVIKSGNDNAKKLCIVLEAIFLHGLKKKALRKRAGSSLVKADARKGSIPAPSIWPLLSSCSPKDVVSQLSRLAYVTTEVGQCRAWICLALNDGIMENYVDSILVDTALMNSWYTDSAFLMDSEQSFSIKTLLQGLSAFNFDLAYDSQDLNIWPIESLQLAGLYSLQEPAAPSQPTDPTFSAGYDPMASFSTLGAALKAKNEPIMVTSEPQKSPRKQKKKFSKEKRSQTVSVVSSTSQPSPPKSEEQERPSILALRESVSSSSASSGRPTAPVSIKRKPKGLTPIKSRSQSDAHASLARRVSDELFVPAHLNTSEISARTPVDNTFGSLFKKHRSTSRTEKEPWKKLESPPPDENVSYDMVTRLPRRSLPDVLKQSSDEDENFGSAELMGFEVVQPSTATSPSESQVAETNLSLLTIVAHEKGLDSQGFQCRSCATPIGMIFGHAKVCKYDGRYYCKDCHKDEESLIPSRLVFNWDFNKYKVSSATKEYLSSIEEEPLLNLAKTNPTLYQHVSNLDDVKMLRIQLRATTNYLYTCHSKTWDQFRKKVWGREYLFENPHLYSLSDFIKVQSGSMAVHLKKVVSLGMKHIYKCKGCSQKGYICEICNNPKIIYPFEVHTAIQCEQCQAVYHKACKDELSPCPKCARVRERRSRTEIRDNNRRKSPEYFPEEK